MVYDIIREEISLIALNYLLSFRTRKYTEQLVKYSRVLYFKPPKNVNLRGGWGWLSERGRIFEKNILSNGEMINLMFHGSSYITRRNFAHCSKLSCFLPHSKKKPSNL